MHQTTILYVYIKETLSHAAYHDVDINLSFLFIWISRFNKTNVPDDSGRMFFPFLLIETEGNNKNNSKDIFFYLTTHSAQFINCYVASDRWDI